MKIAIGADHGGFPLKEELRRMLEEGGQRVMDVGAFLPQPDDDYPDIVRPLAEAVISGLAERGILICGSGVGAAIAANKFPGIHASVCHDTFSSRQGVEDDDMNVLCLGARVIGPELSREVVSSFLGARFSGAERHARRVEKVKGFEREFMK